MLFELYRRLWHHISLQRRIQFSFLLLLMILSSLSEIASIGMVLPFLSILTAPELIFGHELMQPFIKFLEIKDPKNMLLPITVIFVLVALVSGILRVSLICIQISLSQFTGADLSIQIYSRTLYQPYPIHVSRNSSEVISGISQKTNLVVTQIIHPIFEIINSVFLTLAILLTLIAIDPTIAILGFSTFGIIYIIIIILTKVSLYRNSERISRESNQVIKTIQEGLGGIRDVLIDGTQAVYQRIYRKADLSLRRAMVYNSIISLSPRYIIESLGIVLIAVLAYFMVNNKGGFINSIPVLGAIAMGAQRLLPTIQSAYNSFSKIRGGKESFKDALNLLEQPYPEYYEKNIDDSIPFNNNIVLQNVSFRYSDSSPWTLKEIDLKIPKGIRIGFKGTTGSGKSTLLDVVMALLEPTKGQLLIDGIQITQKNCRLWQNHIAHVPQAIFLRDSSIAENIAFGLNKNKIDYNLMREAAQKAQIADTIESWDQQYDTLVGEHGLRLSGGQRQRIAIARSFYKQKDVFIFDEATSALDDKTENAVIKTLAGLKDEVTIIIVAHRMSSLKNCDKIIEILDNSTVLEHDNKELIN